MNSQKLFRLDLKCVCAFGKCHSHTAGYKVYAEFSINSDLFKVFQVGGVAGKIYLMQCLLHLYNEINSIQSAKDYQPNDLCQCISFAQTYFDRKNWHKHTS